MRHDVRAKIKGLAQYRRCEGIVYNQRHMMPVPNLAIFFDIQHGNGGVCNGFAEYHLCIGAERLFDLLFRRIRVNKGYLYAKALKGHSPKIDGFRRRSSRC